MHNKLSVAMRRGVTAPTVLQIKNEWINECQKPPSPQLICDN